MENENLEDPIVMLPIDNHYKPNHQELNIVNNIFPAPTWYQIFDRNKHLVALFALIIIALQEKAQNSILFLLQKIPLKYTKNIINKSILFFIIYSFIIVSIYQTTKILLF